MNDLGSVAILCLPRTSPRAMRNEAAEAAAGMGCVIDGSAPVTVQRTGFIQVNGEDFELDGSGLKAVFFKMKAKR